jgi:AraC-like DNA-binding protein
MQYFFLTGIILSAFHSFVLFSKNDKTISDYLLACWFCLSGMPLFSYYLVYSQKYLTYPSLTVVGMALPLAAGPLLFLYTKYQTNPILFNKNDLLHFIPVMIVSLFFINFYFMPFETRSALLKNGGKDFKVQGLIKLVAIYLSGIVYIPCTLITLLQYKKKLNNQFSNTERINFNWLLYQIIGMAIVWIVILFIQDDRFIFGSVSAFIIWMSYFGSKQINVFNKNTLTIEENSITEVQSELINENFETLKYLKSTLDENTVSEIYKNLLLVLDEKKSYTNPELTLSDLAKLVGVHPNHLSQVINSQTKKSFYDLINERRIQDFILRVSVSENKQYTLVSLAFDCGFNSKASFNRNFKKFTGKTPSDYLNSLKLE